MQQVMLNIKNKELEQKLLEEANKKGRELANIILEVLESAFLQKKEYKLKYKRLAPLDNISRIDYDIDEEDLSDVFPFSEVEDSVAYVKKVRQNAWRKSTGGCSFIR